jgi:hypothetical protein
MASKPEGSMRLLNEVNDPLSGKEGTVFDKPGPQGPPAPVKRQIPPHLQEMFKFLSSKIADEGLLLDLCMDRATSIVEFNFRKRAAGVDMMGEVTPLHFIGPAAMLTVELYKQVLVAVSADEKTYKEILDRAQKEMERGRSPASPAIFVP